jgi:hypothetical protein
LFLFSSPLAYFSPAQRIVRGTRKAKQGYEKHNSFSNKKATIKREREKKANKKLMSLNKDN